MFSVVLEGYNWIVKEFTSTFYRLDGKFQYQISLKLKYFLQLKKERKWLMSA